MKGKKQDLLTRQQLARRLSVHGQTVTKWVSAGCPVARPGRPGHAAAYDELRVRAWLQMRKEGDRGIVDLTRERARHERAQAILAEQAFAMRARNLLPREEVERAWLTEISAVRTRLLAWPMILADRVHRVAVLEGLPGVERVLQEGAREVLNELAKRRDVMCCPRCGADLVTGKKRRRAARRRKT